MNDARPRPVGYFVLTYQGLVHALDSSSCRTRMKYGIAARCGGGALKLKLWLMGSCPMGTVPISKNWSMGAEKMCLAWGCSSATSTSKEQGSLSKRILPRPGSASRMARLMLLPVEITWNVMRLAASLLMPCSGL